MSYQHMTYEEKEEIGILTLNQPHKRNALGQEFEEEIVACLKDAGKRCDVKVIILKAAGEVFCAGHDRMEILNQPLSAIRQLFQTSFNLMTAIRTAPQCIIAQVQGIAMAGGCHLAAGCDLITAGRDKAKFGMTGLIYSYNCSTPTVAVSRAVPQKKCMEMLMTAGLYSAEEARSFHLVNRVFPDDKLDEMTFQWAKEIARASKYVINMSKQVFYSQIEMTEWQAYQYAKEMMAMAGVSTNAIEGFTAFIEKREPMWDEATPF
ncbi:MAG: enoyl-CoA hydratase/isomerase family protein [Deltaproteobacteria bacterium]|nr:enoyl-CoA hydratase/isomerase family protein [Deltaproteobacteria bacterium]